MTALVHHLLQHGLLIVFCCTFAARVGAPLPTAPLLVVAGGLAASGRVSAVGVFLAASVASALGDLLWYVAGRSYGARVMRLLCRISLSPDSCARQSELLITRWGGSAMIASKFVPGVSVVAAPMAGALGMPTLKFLAFDLLAAAIWSASFLALGAAFSAQIREVLEAMSRAGTVALWLLVAALGVVVAYRYWRRRAFAVALEMPRIDVGELRANLRRGDGPFLVDVRSAAGIEADGRRIPGALSVQLGELDARVSELPREREIVVYCNCPNDASAARAARMLVDRGFTRVRPLAGGLDAWVSSGGPVVGLRALTEAPSIS